LPVEVPLRDVCEAAFFLPLRHPQATYNQPMAIFNLTGMQ